MNILIITQYFWPEEFRINELAAMMVARGHQITVLTGIPNYPGGKFFSGYGFTRRKLEIYKGIKVVRVPLIPRGKAGSIRLALNYLSFAFFASILGPFKCRDAYDVIFINQLSPVTVGLPGIVMKKIESASMMLWIHDLWPESLLATGAIHSKVIIKLVEMIVRFIYSECDRILVQSKKFVDNVTQKGVNPSKIAYFPSSAEVIFDNKLELSEFLEHVEFPEGFRVMFTGNIGVAQDFKTILSAAELLKGHRNIHWIIVGDGRMFPWVREQINVRELEKTVHLLGRYPLASMPAFYAKADVMLAALKKEPIFTLTIPVKIQSYMAASRPIIAAIDGEGANVVKEAGAGLTCPAGDSEALANAVMKLSSMTDDDREKMGMNGRVYYDNNFESTMLLDRLDGWLSELVKGKK